MLNSLSWSHATTGTDLPEGLRLAKESVEAQPNSQNIDTLSVLYWLNGDAAGAEKVLVEAMDGATEADRALYQRRLDEVRAGKVSVQ